MNLSDLNNLPLSAIAAYCAAVLGLVFLLSALGPPLPSTLFVVIVCDGPRDFALYLDDRYTGALTKRGG